MSIRKVLSSLKSFISGSEAPIHRRAASKLARVARRAASKLARVARWRGRR